MGNSFGGCDYACGPGNSSRSMIITARSIALIVLSLILLILFVLMVTDKPTPIDKPTNQSRWIEANGWTNSRIIA